MSDLPLSGLKIISFEQFGAAPYATMFLADMGAEVLRIESRDGDYARHTAPLTLGDKDSLYYQCFNLNKQSLVLDLKVPADRALFETLVTDSDAVINNLRGSLPAKLGLDHAALKSINPRIVCGHISAYGRTGSRADWPGYDFLMQAEAGFMALTGDPDTPPARVGLSMVDYMTGMMLAFGTVSALRRAEATGIGMDVDVSLFDAAVHQLAYQGTWFLNEGLVTPRLPRASHPSSTPVQLFRTADGWLYICCMNQKFWDNLVAILERPDLAADPRFAAMAGRTAHRAELTEILDAIFETAPAADWMAKLEGRVPAAPVESLESALANPFLAETGMIAEVPHPSGRSLRMFANPIRLDGERVPQRAAPALDGAGPALRDRAEAAE